MSSFFHLQCHLWCCCYTFWLCYLPAGYLDRQWNSLFGILCHNEGIHTWVDWVKLLSTEDNARLGVYDMSYYACHYEHSLLLGEDCRASNKNSSGKNVSAPSGTLGVRRANLILFFMPNRRDCLYSIPSDLLFLDDLICLDSFSTYNLRHDLPC